MLHVLGDGCIRLQHVQQLLRVRYFLQGHIPVLGLPALLQPGQILWESRKWRDMRQGLSGHCRDGKDGKRGASKGLPALPILSSSHTADRAQMSPCVVLWDAAHWEDHQEGMSTDKPHKGDCKFVGVSVYQGNTPQVE